MSNSKKPKSLSEKNLKSSLNDSDSDNTIQASLDADFTTESKVSKNNNSNSIGISFDKSKSISDSLNDLKKSDELKYDSESSFVASSSVDVADDDFDSGSVDVADDDFDSGSVDVADDDFDSGSVDVAADNLVDEDENVYSEGNLEEDNNENSNLNFKDSNTVSTVSLKPKTPKKSIPLFLTISGLTIGIILLIGGVMYYGTGSDRVVDSVASGETAGLAVTLIFIGFMIIIITVFLALSSKSKLGNVFNEIKGIDESEFDSYNIQDLNDFEENSSDSESKDSDSQKGEIKSYSKIIGTATDTFSVSEKNNLNGFDDFDSVNRTNADINDSKEDKIVKSDIGENKSSFNNSLNEDGFSRVKSSSFKDTNLNNKFMSSGEETGFNTNDFESSITNTDDTKVKNNNFIKRSIVDSNDMNYESKDLNSSEINDSSVFSEKESNFKDNIQNKISELNKQDSDLESKSLDDNESEKSNNGSVEVSFNEALDSIGDLIDESMEKESESKSKSKFSEDESSK